MKEKNGTGEKIIEAAKELFLENGYHETSMSAIAKNADLGKGTLYWHFDSKNDLFQSMVTKEAKHMLKELNELTEKNLEADEILKKFIRIRVKNIDENKKTTQMFMDGGNFINEELKNTMIEIFHSFIDIVEDIIKQGIDEGIFYTSNPEKAASAFIGMINGICSTIILENKGDINIEENTEFIYQLFLNGLQEQKEVERNDEINKE
ncbi:MAG: TetR/AcrR family transcriptional regulator [Bacillota bacterium]